MVGFVVKPVLHLKPEAGVVNLEVMLMAVCMKAWSALGQRLAMKFVAM